MNKVRRELIEKNINSTILRKICCVSFCLFLCIMTSPILWASNFIRVPFGMGASIEIPNNWVILSENNLTSIETFVETVNRKKSDSNLNFAANFYDSNGRLLAYMNARFYPNNKMIQNDALNLTNDDLKFIDIDRRIVVERSLKEMDCQMIHQFNTTKQIINGLYVLKQEHQENCKNNIGIKRVRKLRVWRSPRSFTVTLVYYEEEAKTLLPIIDYMTNSLRQD